MAGIPFDTEFDFEYGRCDQLSPLIRRVIANNPSAFTFTGTGTYIIGTGNVAVIDPGPLMDEHVDAILAALGPDERVSHIVVTHTHLDHSPACKPLQARTHAPTYSFAPPNVESYDGWHGRLLDPAYTLLLCKLGNPSDALHASALQ